MHVAAIQLHFAFVASPQAFMDAVRPPIERAAEGGARLIVLPNYTGYMLFGLFVPGLEGGSSFSLAKLAAASKQPVSALMRERAGMVLEFYTHVFQSLAERTGAWIIPGTAPESTGGDWYNLACLFSPEGRLAGCQRQTHRSEEERAGGMGRGAELQVFETEIGTIGMVSGEDVRYPEVSRILALQGASVLAHPAAARTTSAEQYLADLWREVQSNQTFGVQANLADDDHRGRSAIYAPVEATADHRGIITQAESDSDEAIVSGELDFAAREKAIGDYPLVRFMNPEFYRREFPQVYGDGT